MCWSGLSNKNSVYIGPDHLELKILDIIDENNR